MGAVAPRRSDRSRDDDRADKPERTLLRWRATRKPITTGLRIRPALVAM